MVNSLLVRLATYAPREGRFAQEDFFSEVVAYILRKDSGVLKAFLRLIGWRIYHSNTDSLRIGTQYELMTGCRADIVITDTNSDTECIIESKIGSLFDRRQIRRYLTRVRAKSGSRVVSITNDPLEEIALRDKQFKHLYWFEVYHCFKSLKMSGTESNTPYLISEILQFMEAENMAEFEGFGEDEIGAWSTYETLRSKVDIYITHLKTYLKDKCQLMPSTKPASAPSYRGYKIVKEGNHSLKNTLWVGLFNLDFGRGRRTYCCVQIQQDTALSFSTMQQIIPRIKKPENSWPGIYLPLTTVIGPCEKDEQEKKLDAFFVETIGLLKKKGLLAKCIKGSGR